MMNRLNWMRYLKILYDQIFKIKVAIPSQNQKSQASFLSLNSKDFHSNPGSPAASSNQTLTFQEKIERDQLVKALRKTGGLLPLMTKSAYEKSRYRAE